MRRSLAILLIPSLCLPLFVHATPVFKYVDSRGKVSFTDQPPHDAYVKLEKTWKGWQDPTPPKNYRANKKKFQKLVIDVATRHNIESELISAIIHVESYYNPRAESSAGALGLMQLMPETARRYGVSNRQNPEQNIEGGVRYLSELMSMFGNDLNLVLAAYNAGENAVKRHGNRIPPYPETRLYVAKVLKLYKEYQVGNI